jgi:hypothetical protein
MTTTLPLRELLRQPARVKKLTAAGHRVRITDHGRPLWVMKSDCEPEDTTEAERVAASWDEALTELEQALVRQSPRALSAAKLLLDQRREDLR